MIICLNRYKIPNVVKYPKVQSTQSKVSGIKC